MPHMKIEKMSQTPYQSLLYEGMLTVNYIALNNTEVGKYYKTYCTVGHEGQFKFSIKFYPSGCDSDCSKYISVRFSLENKTSLSEEALSPLINSVFTLSVWDEGADEIETLSRIFDKEKLQVVFPKVILQSDLDILPESEINMDFSILIVGHEEEKEETKGTAEKKEERKEENDQKEPDPLKSIVVLNQAVLAAGKYCDVKFIVGEGEKRTEFLAHRAIIAPRSRKLEKLFDAHVRGETVTSEPESGDNNSQDEIEKSKDEGAVSTSEVDTKNRDIYKSSSAEGNLSVIKVDCEPEVMAEVLTFIYCGTIEKSLSEKIFLVARAFEIIDLKSVCQKMIIDSLDTKNVYRILELAEKFQEATIREQTLEFIRRNYGKIKIDKESFTDGIRSLSEDACKSFILAASDSPN